MLDNILTDGTEDKFSFLLEYLVTKGLVTQNAKTWITQINRLVGLNPDMLLKSDNKESIVKFIDGMSYPYYLEAMRDNLYCKKCKQKVLFKEENFKNFCSLCGDLDASSEVEIDHATLQMQINNFLMQKDSLTPQST